MWQPDLMLRNAVAIALPSWPVLISLGQRLTLVMVTRTHTHLDQPWRLMLHVCKCTVPSPMYRVAGAQRIHGQQGFQFA